MGLNPFCISNFWPRARSCGLIHLFLFSFCSTCSSSFPHPNYFHCSNALDREKKCSELLLFEEIVLFSDLKPFSNARPKILQKVFSITESIYSYSRSDWTIFKTKYRATALPDDFYFWSNQKRWGWKKNKGSKFYFITYFNPLCIDF